VACPEPPLPHPPSPSPRDRCACATSGDRDVDLDRHAAEPGPPDGQRAAELARPGGHVDQPTVLAGRASHARRPQAASHLLGPAATVVGDRQSDLVAAVGQPHQRAARVRVHGGVEQRLAGHAEQRLLALAGERHRLAVDAHVDAQLVRHVYPGQPAQHRREVFVRVALAVVQRVDRGAQLLDSPAGEVLGGVEMGAQSRVGDLAAGQLDVHPGRERVLRDAVVQLAGDAVPLGVEHLALTVG
jgi:hypothetical protein